MGLPWRAVHWSSLWMSSFESAPVPLLIKKTLHQIGFIPGPNSVKKNCVCVWRKQYEHNDNTSMQKNEHILPENSFGAFWFIAHQKHSTSSYITIYKPRTWHDHWKPGSTYPSLSRQRPPPQTRFWETPYSFVSVWNFPSFSVPWTPMQTLSWLNQHPIPSQLYLI